jgi:hypothetical protein
MAAAFDLGDLPIFFAQIFVSPPTAALKFVLQNCLGK